jgi:hypothetical protein
MGKNWASSQGNDTVYAFPRLKKRVREFFVSDDFVLCLLLFDYLVILLQRECLR